MKTFVNWAFSWLVRVFTKQAVVKTVFAPTLDAITDIAEDIKSGNITYVPGKGYINIVNELPVNAEQATLIKSLTMSLSKDLLRSKTIELQDTQLKVEGESNEEDKTI